MNNSRIKVHPRSQSVVPPLNINTKVSGNVELRHTLVDADSSSVEDVDYIIDKDLDSRFDSMDFNADRRESYISEKWIEAQPSKRPGSASTRSLVSNDNIHLINKNKLTQSLTQKEIEIYKQ